MREMGRWWRRDLRWLERRRRFGQAVVRGVQPLVGAIEPLRDCDRKLFNSFFPTNTHPNGAISLK